MVASSKAFTSQLTLFALLALKAAWTGGGSTPRRWPPTLNNLNRLPGLMNHALALSSEIAVLAEDLARAQDILFLGRGPMYPMALEGALKLKEISYIHAECYASGELKHGPIALIDARFRSSCWAPRDALFDKTVSNMQEVMARHGKVLLISDAPGLAEAGQGTWARLQMPAVDAIFAPILYAVPAQLLAYHTPSPRAPMWTSRATLRNPVTVE